MPRWSDFLDRFRPAGAPGAAVPRGVPVDRAVVAAAELMPLLARLDAVQDDAERIRRDADARAVELHRDGEHRADELVALARENAETVAAQAASQALAETEGTRSANDQPVADDIERRVAQRLPEYVDRVVAAARELLTELCEPDLKSATR